MRVDRNLGRVAHAARREADVTLLSVAQLAGVSEATLSRFERRGGWPKHLDAIIDAYSRACGVTPRELWQAALDMD